MSLRDAFTAIRAQHERAFRDIDTALSILRRHKET